VTRPIDQAAELKAFQEKIRLQTAQIAATAKKKSRFSDAPAAAAAPPAGILAFQ